MGGGAPAQEHSRTEEPHRLGSRICHGQGHTEDEVADADLVLGLSAQPDANAELALRARDRPIQM